MKKLVFILLMTILPAVLLAQVTLTADSNYIKIERSLTPTVILFTKDVRIGYYSTTLYFTNSQAVSGWEYTIKYSEISTYNGVAKASGSFPSFATMRDALIEFIKKGKTAILIKN
jgi:hypothetical protein